MLNLVETCFDAALRVALVKVKPEVREHIIGHERKQLCVTRLTEQIRMAEMKAGGRFGVTQFNLMCSTGARLFAHAVLAAAEAKAMSSAEQARRVTEAGALDAFEAEQKELQEGT